MTIKSKLSSRKASDTLILWGIGGSGAAGLIYEVIWQRALTNTVGGTVYSFSILLAAFLAGLAIGGYFGGRYVDQHDDPIKIFGLLQLGIGVFGAITLYIINGLGPIYGELFYRLSLSFTLFTLAQMLLVFLVLLLPTILMGASFPVAVKAWAHRLKEIGREAGDIYAINTWGAAIGALVAGFILIPMVGLRWANLFAVAINLTIALFSFSLSKSQRLAVISAIVFGGAIIISLIKPSPGIAFGYGIADHFASYGRYEEINRNSRTLFDKESNYGRVQVFKNLEQDGLSNDLFLMINGRFEGASRDDTNVRLLSYLPTTILKKPRSAMVIGLGTGTTLATLAKDKNLESIDSVEINPTAYEAVEKHFYPNLFKDKRINQIGDDARHYMGLTRKKYDIIISAPSYPATKAVSHLFTKDYYDIVNSKLSRNGVFVQWLPGYFLGREDMQIAVKTLLSAYPNTYAVKVHNNDIIFIALKSKKRLDVDEIEAEINGLGDKNIWGWNFRVGPRTLALVVSSHDISLNTDDLPLIEFTSMRKKYSPKDENAQEVRGLESILQR